jgi:hypothetical protein
VKFNAKKRRKVILLGDSHIRGCSEILGDLLGTSFSVIGITKPNANMKAVITPSMSKPKNYQEEM